MHIVEEDEIDIKALLLEVYRAKYTILFFIFLFTVASGCYAYFLPNIYRASASVKVGLDEEAYKKDVVAMAMGKGAVNAATEKDLITSHYLSAKALKKVDFTHHYYVTEKFRERELYKSSPIKVTLSKGYNLRFTLYPVDQEKYRLVLDGQVFRDGDDFIYDMVHRYGKQVTTDYFNLKVERVKNLIDKEYHFIIDKANKSFGQVFVSQNSERSTILHIAVEDTVPMRAEEYANALAEAYVEHNVESKTREAMQRLNFIDVQLKTISEEIKKSEGNLEVFRRESKLVNVNEKSETVSTRLERYEERLISLTLKEEMLKEFQKKVKENRQIETLSIEGIDDDESILAKLMTSLQDTILEKRVLREDYTNLHPLVQKNNRKIKQLKSTIINTVKNLLYTLEKRKRLLMRNIAEQKVFLNTLPKNARKYGQLERQFKMNEELNTYLMQRKSEAEMVRASTVSKNRVLDRAIASSSPIKPKRSIIVLIGMLVGFFVGVGMIFLRRLWDTKIKNENDISQIVSYPILATIPHFEQIEEGWKGKIKVFDSESSAVAEAFRHLRSNLQFIRKKDGPQIILLTSTVGQEGKTTISVNLAAVMSLTKKRTIIVNLDMRKPTLHLKFDLPNQLGLSEVLNGRVELTRVIQHTRYAYLDILSSGAVPPNPSELIQSEKMYIVLEELKKSYDTIILDTPPIGLVTDAKELMHHVDTNIYIVRAEYSKKEFLENLKKFNFVEHIDNLGIILNDITFKKGHYGYYPDYGYYSDK